MHFSAVGLGGTLVRFYLLALFEVFELFGLEFSSTLDSRATISSNTVSVPFSPPGTPGTHSPTAVKCDPKSTSVLLLTFP